MDIARAIEVAEKLILLAIRVMRAAGSASGPDGTPTRIPEDHGMRSLLKGVGLTDDEVKNIMGA